MVAKDKIIKNAVEYIKEKIAPDKIFLFGSYAKGTQTETSDLDFFIIKETPLPRFKRALSLYSTGKSKKIGANIGVDFIIYTPDEYEEQKNDLNSIVGEVKRTGKLVYDKKRTT
ncbi:MAG: nucleotidyltransferase domain-containing protein [bacterium]